MDSSSETFGQYTIYTDELIGGSNDTFRGIKQTWTTNPLPISVKRISKTLYPDYQKRVTREIEGMNKNITISNVINFIDIISVPNDNPFIYIACENFYYNLKDHILENQLNVEVCDILENAVNGMFHIHKNKMTHRDIHPENILICLSDGKYVGKISNLALSKEFKGKQDKQSVSQCFLERNGFVAPELYNSIGPYKDGVDTAVDIFSMGVVIFYALTGGELLFYEDGTEMQDNIADANFEINFDALDNSETVETWKIGFFKQLILNMVSRQPITRPTASDVLKHPVFWKYEFIEDFIECANAYAQGDFRLKSLINYDNRMFDNWKNGIDNEIYDFILQGLLKRKFSEQQARNHSDFYDAANLLRCIRNVLSHYTDKNQYGLKRLFRQKEDIIPYFFEKFPDLLNHVFHQAQGYKKIETLKKFYGDYNF